MKLKKNILLSQCMIVKNEETNIEKALSWARGIVCEQIVVDTGSTDRTVELAEAMGASVYHFQWIDDFAAAKNYAISKAKGDWIAFLDADEYFKPEDARKLVPLLTKLDRTSYYVMLTDWLQLNEEGEIFSGGTQARIFKRVPGLKYKGRIHELLALDGVSIVDVSVDATEELAIYHTGYALETSMDRKKGERNLRLIQMDLDEDPYNYDMMGYLGDSYFAMDGGMEKAEEWYRKAISLMPSQINDLEARSAATFWKLMLILNQKDDEAGLMEVYEKAVSLIPRESDFDYIAGKYYVGKKNFAKGAYHLERAVGLLEKYENVNRGALITGSLPGTWELLAACYYQTGDLHKCVNSCSALLKTDRYMMGTLVMMLMAFGSQTDASDVAVFLGNLYDMNTLKDRIFLLRASMQAGFQDLVKIMRGTCSPEELACYDRSMGERS